MSLSYSTSEKWILSVPLLQYSCVFVAAAFLLVGLLAATRLCGHSDGSIRVL